MPDRRSTGSEIGDRSQTDTGGLALCSFESTTSIRFQLVPIIRPKFFDTLVIHRNSRSGSFLQDNSFRQRDSRYVIVLVNQSVVECELAPIQNWEATPKAPTV